MTRIKHYMVTKTRQKAQWTYWTGIGAVDHGKSFGVAFAQVDNTLAAVTTTDAADAMALTTVYNGLDDVDFIKLQPLNFVSMSKSMLTLMTMVNGVFVLQLI